MLTHGDFYTWCTENLHRSLSKVIEAKSARHRPYYILVTFKKGYDSPPARVDNELLNWTPDETAIAQAEADLKAAQADYQAAESKSAADQTASARINLEQAQQSLLDAQDAYDTAWDPARDWELYDSRQGPKLEAEREEERSNDAFLIASIGLEAVYQPDRLEEGE